MTDYLAYATTATGVPITECEVCGQRHPERRFGRLCDTLGVSTERPQPVSLHLTSRGLTATQPHLAEGGIVAETTVPEKNRCGTQSGYSAHQYRAERPCDACAKAKAEYDKRRNEAPERAARARLRARAQNRAEGRLRHMYPAVWRVIYAEELARVHAEDND